MEEVQFRISAALKDLIGKELITDEFVAMFELVKNSFDANAKHVKIVFENQYDSKIAKIIIWDDGRGMNATDLHDKWLFVAYSAKKDGSEDKDYRDKIKSRRIFAGAKGVGRFSCDRLGRYLNLITLKDEKKASLENLVVDWAVFEKDSKEEFVNIAVVRNTLNSVPYDNFTQGTILEITGLRDIWTRDKVLRLKYSLEKLINPIQENDAENFDIEIIARDELNADRQEEIKRKKVNGKIGNIIIESLGLQTTQIQAEIIENGTLIKTSLIDRGREIYWLKEKNPYSLLSAVKIKLFALNFQAKYNFTKMMNIRPVQYGSVFIYKNGFRIYPYGEENDDTLGVDRRKQQGYNRYLGTRDLIGRIEINGEVSDLRETTSRDGGLIKNNSYIELVDFFYDKALKRLEKYVVDVIKWGDSREDKETGETISALTPEDVKAEILEIISNLTNSKEVIDIGYDDNFLQLYENRQSKSATQLVKNIVRIAEEKNDSALLEHAREVDNKIKQLLDAKISAEKENELNLIERHAVEKKLEHFHTENLFLRSDIGQNEKSLISLQHHITHTANKVSKYLLSAIQAVKEKNEDGALLCLNRVYAENQKIAILSNFVSKANFDTTVNKINKDITSFVNEYIENVFNLPPGEISRTNMSVVIEPCKEPFITKFMPIELIMAIENLLSNSEKAKAKHVKIYWENLGDMLKLHFIDDGKGISEDVLPYIFDYRFTTTNGGGLGLFHTKDILKRLNGTIEANSKINEGAEFIITLRK